MPAARFVLPPQHAGYWRGAADWPETGGSGPQVAVNVPGLSAQAAPGMSGNWHPTVMYMMIFVIAEIFMFHFLSRHLNII